MKRILALVIWVVAGARAVAQSGGGGGFVSLDSSAAIAALDAKITLALGESTIANGVTQIARIASLRATFDPSLPGLSKLVTMSFNEVTARSALQRLLKGSGIAARVSAAGQIALVPAPKREEADIVRVTVRGAVHYPEGGPVEGARVDLVGTRYATYSRPDGTFDLGSIPEGSYSLRAMQIGTRPQMIQNFVVAAPATTTELTLEHAPIPLGEVVVTPAHYGLVSASVSSPRVMDRVQLETVPQLGEDIYRAIGRLPGVASDDFSAKFSVRGATGDELFVTLDGLPLIEPFHLKDLANALSIIDIQTLGHAELVAGGAPAQFGDHTGGVLRMETLDPRAGRARGSAGISIMNARVMADGSLSNGRVGWLLSARRGYVDIALKLADINDSIRPRYFDLFGKINVDAGRFGRISLHGLRAYDNMKYSETQEPTLNSRYRSDYGWLRWKGALGSAEHETVLSLSALEWRRDGDQWRDATKIVHIRDVRSMHRVELRQDWVLPLADRLMIRFGGNISEERSAFDFDSRTGRDTITGPGTVGLKFDTVSVHADPGSRRSGAYFSARIRPIPSLTVEGGLRYDRATHSGDDIVSPRLNASWRATSSTTIKAAFGEHSQTQPLHSLQVQNGQSVFSRADRARQREVGIEQALLYSMGLRVQAYDRRMSDQRSRWINVGSQISALPEISYDREFVAPSGGLSRGVEASIGRERQTRFEWNVAYTLSKVTDDIGGVAVPRSNDQRHAYNIDLALHPASNKWRLTTAAVWHTGWPYTPDVTIVDTLANTPNQFWIYTGRTPGDLNSARTPAYTRVDMRWTRYFETHRGRVMLFAEVFNLLDHRNVRGRYTNVAVRGRVVTLQPGLRESLGRLPSVGFSWEF